MSNARVATTLAMLAIFSAMTAIALSFPDKAAFTPMLVGIPGIVLCLVQLAIDVTGRAAPTGPGNAGPDNRKDLGDEEFGDRDGDAVSRRDAIMFGWLAVFTAALVGLGFHIGGPLVVFFYIRFGEGEPWRNALFAGVGTFLVIWLIFTKLLELPLFTGLLLPAVF